jgi:hypothetical protein
LLRTSDPPSGPCRPNLQFDIFRDGDFRHDCGRFALRAAPAPGLLWCGLLEPCGPHAAVGAGLPSTTVVKCSRGQSWTRKIATVTASDDKARHRAPQRHSRSLRMAGSPDRRRTRLHPSNRQLGHGKGSTEADPSRYTAPHKSPAVPVETLLDRALLTCPELLLHAIRSVSR